jgi:oligoendopeptidase F
MKNHIFTRNVRKFDTCLEAALYNDNIPTTVYRQLIADVHANLPTLHRYLKLRARMMGLTDLGYEDLYAPIVNEVNLTYTPEQAIDLTVNAVKPLGAEYAKVLGDGLTKGGWVDWIPTTGKRSGAYSTIAYGVHPYQLLNFTGNYDEV